MSNNNDYGLENIGKCPVCGSIIAEGKISYSCMSLADGDENDCRFSIKKEICGKNITRNDVISLLEQGKTEVIDGFENNKGEVFNSKLKLSDDKKNVVFESDDLNDESNNDTDIKQNKKESFGNCPNCKGDIIEGNKGYGCSNWRQDDGNCRFVIWKEMSGKKISKKMAKQLLKNGETEVIENFTSRAKGTKFDAKLKIKNEDDKYKVAYEFPDSGTDPIGKCPLCDDGNVVESKKAYGCSNWRSEDGNCKFVIWKEISRKKITQDIAKQLLEDGQTDKLSGFISKNGNSFETRLKLASKDENCKLIFDFD